MVGREPLGQPGSGSRASTSHGQQNANSLVTAVLEQG